MPNRQHAITRTNADHVHWCIWTALWGDKSNIKWARNMVCVYGIAIWYIVCIRRGCGVYNFALYKTMFYHNLIGFSMITKSVSKQIVYYNIILVSVDAEMLFNDCSGKTGPFRSYAIKTTINYQGSAMTISWVVALDFDELSCMAAIHECARGVCHEPGRSFMEISTWWYLNVNGVIITCL